MSRRTQNRNQYESTTTGDLAIGALTVSVVSTAGLLTDQPMYIVIEPDVPGQREWLRVGSITGNQFNLTQRELEGSDGDLLHPAGSKMRSMPTQQIFEDIFQDAEDDELSLTQHETDGGDPHAQAGYLNQADGDQLYVNISGDTMNSLAQIKVDTNPQVNDDLSRKGYVDDSIDADIAAHAALPDVHHVAFVQADADALYLTETQADLLYLQLSGGTMTGLLILSGPPTTDLGAATRLYVDDTVQGGGGSHDNLSGVTDAQHHDKYTDANAVSAMGATNNNNTLRHNRYSDANARSAVDNGTYLKLTGGTITGNLIINGTLDMGNDRINNVTHLEFGNHSGLGNVAYSIVFNDSFWRFRSGAANDLITFNGNEINFDMNNFSAPGMNATTGTTMVFNAGGQFGPQTSARRFKKNLKLIDKASIKAALSKLSVYEFQYKDAPDETHMGWMAEDVAEVHPMLATYDKDGRVFAINQLAVLAVLT